MRIHVQALCVALALGATSCFVLSNPQENAAQNSGSTIQPDTTTLVQEFKAAADRSRQAEIGEKLVALQDKSIVPAMLELLDSPNRVERCNAGRVLAGLGDDRGLFAIIAELQDTSNNRLNTDEEAQLKGWPKDKAPTRQINGDRYYAAHVLGIVGDKRAVPALIDLLNDKNLAYQAAYVLGRLGDKRALSPLHRKRAQLQSDSKNQRQYSNTSDNRLATFAASAALAQLGNAQGMTELTGYLKDRNWLWRRRAVEMFGEMGAARAVPLLTPMLRDSSERVRISAAQSLGKIGDKAALSALVVAQCPDDANISWRTETLARAADEAINEIWRKNGITGMATKNGKITGYSYALRSKPHATTPTQYDPEPVTVAQ